MKFFVGQKVRLRRDNPPDWFSKCLSMDDVATVMLMDPRNGELVLLDRCGCGGECHKGESGGKPWWHTSYLEAVEDPITPEEVARAKSLPSAEDAFRFVMRGKM